MGWDSSDLWRAVSKPRNLVLQSWSSRNTRCLCCLPDLTHTPITVIQSAKS